MGQNSKALDDINKAIELSKDEGKAAVQVKLIQFTIFEKNIVGKCISITVIADITLNSSLFKQAYTQRAMLQMLNKNEEEARLDFEKAAYLGGRFAACQAAKLNPYAKLCNQMLTKAMDSLQQ